jgi:CheY-like chemotaxis protein
MKTFSHSYVERPALAQEMLAILSESSARHRAPSLGDSLTMAYRILVVEDEPDTQEMLATLLKLDGHRVETADSGQEALNLLAGRSYDVILSNIRMPGMDGSELYRRIEQRWPHLAPRFVFVTAEGSTGFQAQYGGAPVPLLAKPYTVERLRQVIARVVEQNT